MKTEKLAIPQRFFVAGIPVDVVMQGGFLGRTGDITKIDYAAQSITMDPIALKQESLDQAYLQNVIRYCLYAMSEHDLRQNDKFTDSLAHLLHQALTMKED